jgi:hypothetical protein
VAKNILVIVIVGTMNKVYILFNHCGQYEDYRKCVSGVYSSRESADAQKIIYENDEDIARKKLDYCSLWEVTYTIEEFDLQC